MIEEILILPLVRRGRGIVVVKALAGNDGVTEVETPIFSFHLQHNKFCCMLLVSIITFLIIKLVGNPYIYHFL